MLDVRKIDAKSVEIENQLCNGITVITSCRKCKFQLERVSVEFEDKTGFRPVSTALGVVYLTNAIELLNQISTSPVIENCDEPWISELYNRNLASDVRNLFGYISILEREEKPSGSYLLNLNIIAKRKCISGHVLLKKKQLSEILRAVKWNRSRRQLNKDFRFSFPWDISVIKTNKKELLKKFSVGAVIVPNASVFITAYNHELKINNVRLEGTYTSIAQEGIYFEVKFIELNGSGSILQMSSSNIKNTNGEDSNEMNSSDIENFEIELHMRCGNIKLSISELEMIKKGSYVKINSYQNHQVFLYHHDTMLAKGELVDVDGSLGMQITKLNNQLFKS
ncbi:TPA: FliM/FliN family flagellar motor switch protein [Serratia marcescens]